MAGATTITYGGHSAVFVRFDADSGSESTVVGVDPWLAGNPLCPEPLKSPQQLDIIVATHGHSDHASEITSLAKNYGSKVVATFELANLFHREGVPEGNLIGMNKGGTVAVGDLQITLTNAFHSNSYDTAIGPVYAGEACGAVIRGNGKSIYHAGDTLLFSDMSLIRELYAPDVALLPIGDLFTMGPKEAAMAAELIGANISIPIHFGTFPVLHGTPEEFTSECGTRGLQSVVLGAGEEFLVG